MLLVNKGDIVFVNFPFEEDGTIYKSRPCLVLAVDDENKKFLAAKITTTPLNRSWAVELKQGTEDMKTGSLRSESWINLNRREWIPYSDYIFKIGSINADILLRVMQKMQNKI